LCHAPQDSPVPCDASQSKRFVSMAVRPQRRTMSRFSDP
jgi:hypothetical protein